MQIQLCSVFMDSNEVMDLRQSRINISPSYSSYKGRK